MVSKNAALKEALLAVKDVYEQAEVAGISSFLKIVAGVGLPDTGRCIISVEEGKYMSAQVLLVSVKEWQPLRRKLPVKH